MIRQYNINCKKKYSINLTVSARGFCLCLHFNAANRYLFVNGAEIIKFQAKDPEIVATPLCLGNISKDFSEDKIKRQAYMYMSMILLLIIMLLQLTIY